MSRHKRRIQPAVLKAKPAPPYLDVLSFNLTVTAATVMALGKHMRHPRLADESWVADANKYSKSIARLYQVAVDMQPPAEHEALHRHWTCCIRAFHEFTTLAFTTANDAPADSNAWRRVSERVAIGWRWWTVVQMRCTRLRAAQVALRGFENAELVA